MNFVSDSAPDALSGRDESRPALQQSSTDMPHDLSYILNHLGEERETYRGAVSPPIFQSSIFAFETVDKFRQGFKDEFRRTTYTRGNNPPGEILRKKVAALEGADDCLMFGSGAGAISAAVMASVAAGDHVICV